MLQRFHPFIYACALVLALITAWLAYAPGIHGDFLFDDYANLPTLGAYGPVNSWPSFLRYITSGNADFTGRPVALLSFLIDANNWPAAPESFKRTGVILHLINGVLLATLLGMLGRALAGTRAAADKALAIDLAAVVGMTFWLLHPLLVSTTLYIVQREAMLPATFTILGLLLWLHGRSRMEAGDVARGLLWIVLGLCGCTLLGVLSKANGALLPALALTIEYTILSSCKLTRANTGALFDPDTVPSSTGISQRAPALTGVIPRDTSIFYRWTMRLLAWLPAALIALYLIRAGWTGVVDGVPSIRPWTLGQRLLTEPRILMNYLDVLWVPRPFTAGLFNDHIRASTSWLTPATTLPSLLAVLALITAALIFRKKWSATSLAILFYFVGQSIESTSIPLELYFEHRNYLPSMLMFWPVALWLCNVRPAALHATSAPSSEPHGNHDHRVALAGKFALALALFAGLAAMAHARADLWGNGHVQALLWAKLNPDSPRAQANAAQAEMAAGRPEQAVERLAPAIAMAPAEVQLALNLLGARCQQGSLDQETLGIARTALRTTRDPGSLLTTWFERVIEGTRTKDCPELTPTAIRSLLDAGMANPVLAGIPGRRQDFFYLQGRLDLAAGEANNALANFNRALSQEVRLSAALGQAALLGSRGYPRQGLAHLDYFEKIRGKEERPAYGMPLVHVWVLERQQYWQKELLRLRATLREDAASQTSGIQ